MVSRFCLNSPLLFSFSSFKHSVSHLFLSSFDVSEKCFFPTNWRRHLLFFLFLQFVFFFCFCSLVFFFFEKVCMTNPFIFELFVEFLVNPFSLFTFFSRKNQPRHLHFLFLLSPFSVSLLLSTFFLIFYHHFFFHHFPSFLFVHPFLLFSSFSLLSFLHSFFISLSQCFSFSFCLYLMFTHLFFLHRRCCVSSFCFNSFFFCLSLLILISLFSCFFSLFFFITVSVFFQKKIKFFCGQFFEDEIVFIFWTLPLSVLNLVCFSSLRRHFPCLFYVFCCCDSSSLLFLIIVTFLDFLLSIFFLGLSKKIRFVL